ncbi:MAG: undecaprenyl diphosphate synthase [Salibacteraceae bacterium]|jgi:undecaprenyl diphosphate synthase
MGQIFQSDQLVIPKHIAVIMDGNGRWAKEKGKARIFGHRSALTAVRDTIEGCAEIGVDFLTLYAFSSENWNRPKLEVAALMELLVSSIRKELKNLNKNEIKLMAIGDISTLPKKGQAELASAIESTKNNKRMTLVLALSYGSRSEILNAVKKISTDVKNGEILTEDIDEVSFERYLATHSIPDPDLLIRTSGENRISNFLLWQIAYSELLFIDKYWPDFRKSDLNEAIASYQKRERRFGKTSEQI